MLMKYLSVLFLLFVCISCLLIGCTININFGGSAGDATNKPDSTTVLGYVSSDENTKNTIYECHASVCISKNSADTAVSSVDLKIPESVIETCKIILQSSLIQNEISKEYPNAEYTLTLNSIEGTGMFTIIATSNNPNHLDAICNKVASLFCEKSAAVIEGYSYKIVDYAYAAQSIEVS